MTAMHEKSCLILELSLAVTGATDLPTTGAAYLLNVVWAPVSLSPKKTQ